MNKCIINNQIYYSILYLYKIVFQLHFNRFIEFMNVFLYFNNYLRFSTEFEFRKYNLFNFNY